MNKCCFIIKCILEIVFSLIIIRDRLYPVISQTAPVPRSRDGGQVGPRLLFRISAGLRSVEHQSRPRPSDDHRSSPTSISSLVHALEATMFSDFDLQPCPRPSLSTPFAVDALQSSSDVFRLRCDIVSDVLGQVLVGHARVMSVAGNFFIILFLSLKYKRRRGDPGGSPMFTI